MVTQIADGIFFTRPDRRAPAQRDLSPDEALTEQRQSLLIAVTELMALMGYASFGIREVATRADVSISGFYQCFADKDECVFAAYDRFIEVMTGRVLAAIDGPTDWDSMVTAVVGAYLTALDADPVVTRAFQVEMDALGRPARERRRQALNGMAVLLKARRDEVWPGAEDVPLSAYIGAVYAVRQLACDRVDDDDPEVAGLNDEVQPWIALMLEHSRTSRPLH